MAPDCQCCIAGAGPAGMLLALLLARKGVSVKLLEVRGDLDRDFRGDTVHASTLEVLDQIGLAEGVLQLPHDKLQRMVINAAGREIETVNFSRLATRFPFIAMMPQHLLLEYLLNEARRYPNFEMLYNTPAVELIEIEGEIKGVRCTGRQAENRGQQKKEIYADLVVAADGRFSQLRKLSKLTATTQSPPMDVAWFRLPRFAGDAADYLAAYIAQGRMCILLARGEHWQIGYVFPKGDFHEIRKAGIGALQADLAGIVPWLADRVSGLQDFGDVHLLSVKSDLLDTWYKPGLLLIGDAAHVMSPVGGVGINYAISDAVAAANAITEPLLSGQLTPASLARVQESRFEATRSIQRIQGFVQERIVKRALSERAFDLPLIAKIILRTPGLRDIPAKAIALGLRPVRIENP